MEPILLVTLSILFSGIACKPPDFGTHYTVQGTLQLPYAEINENFTAYYDSKANASRIEFYDGLTIALQRSDKNLTYKVMNTTFDKGPKGFYNQRKCYKVPPEGSKTDIQSVFPDLTYFKLQKSGTSYMLTSGESYLVDEWQNVTVVGNKKNTYTFYVISTKTTRKGLAGKPLRYEMIGYDSLFGSHYDRYYVNYYPATFNNNKISPDLFNPAKLPSQPCTNLTPDVSLDMGMNVNPMKEYINNDKSHVTTLFNKFKKTYKREYDGKIEHDLRKDHFAQAVRFIHSKNRENLGYTLNINHLADRYDSERKHMRGRIYRPGYNGGQPFHMELYNDTKTTPVLDWRLFGAVTPVKDQGVCGSCWSFGTTGSIEGTYFIKTGKLVRLSQQELMDCSWGEGNGGCDGGEETYAYDWILKNKLATEEDYGPYLAVDGGCHSKQVNPTIKISGFVNVTSGNSDALKMALFKYGPITVNIDASHMSLSYYSHGVYYEPKCKNGPEDLDHSVLAVGYGIQDGEPYWLVKNSWSTHWGNDGYVLMAARDNNCGVTTAATYVLM